MAPLTSHEIRAGMSDDNMNCLEIIYSSKCGQRGAEMAGAGGTF